MYLINDALATHGLEAQWGSGLTDDMIAQPDVNNKIDGFYVLDLRESMLDARNPPSTYRRLIERACGLVHQYGKVVICCSAGVSRSNAIAIGVLVGYYGLGFDEAFSLVKSKVPIANPLPCHLKQIRLL